MTLANVDKKKSKSKIYFKKMTYTMTNVTNENDIHVDHC